MFLVYYKKIKNTSVVLLYKKRKRSHGDIEVDMTPRESWAYAQAERTHWEETEKKAKCLPTCWFIRRSSL